MPFLLRMYYILVNSFLAPLGPHRFCPTFRDMSSYWALSPILRSFLSILSELPYCTIVILFSLTATFFRDLQRCIFIYPLNPDNENTSVPPFSPLPHI